jgi:hypothetical protein
MDQHRPAELTAQHQREGHVDTAVKSRDPKLVLGFAHAVFDGIGVNMQGLGGAP